jgi:hypothetical protein
LVARGLHRALAEASVRLLSSLSAWATHGRNFPGPRFLTPRRARWRNSWHFAERLGSSLAVVVQAWVPTLHSFEARCVLCMRSRCGSFLWPAKFGSACGGAQAHPGNIACFVFATARPAKCSTASRGEAFGLELSGQGMLIRPFGPPAKVGS